MDVSGLLRKAVVIIFSTLILFTGVNAFSAEAANKSSLSVLFIGNSLTSVNDLPKTFTAIAASLGDQVNSSMVAPGGYLLKQHTTDKTTKAAISSGHWNYVVLQEQSQVPAIPQTQYQQLSAPFAKALNDMIRQNGGKTVIFETWGLKNGDPINCETMSNLCSYEGMQDAITRNTTQLAISLEATLAPVGKAWSLVRKLYPDIELYQHDGKHPSVAGTYLAACVIYGTIFNKPTHGATMLTLDSKTSEILQGVADQTVKMTRN